MSKLEIERSVVVAASAQAVWERWTTSAGVASFFADDNSVVAELGGAFEMYFMPEADEIGRGSEGCTFLALEPFERLAFSWNASPATPTLRAQKAMTRVDISLAELEPGKTEVTLHHYELGVGGEWPEYHAYFERAWGMVLVNLRDSFGKP